jgi:hypothetical protein
MKTTGRPRLCEMEMFAVCRRIRPGQSRKVFVPKASSKWGVDGKLQPLAGSFSGAHFKRVTRRVK